MTAVTSNCSMNSRNLGAQRVPGQPLPWVRIHQKCLHSSPSQLYAAAQFSSEKILEMKEAVFEVKNMFRKRFKESCFWCFHRLTKDLIMVQASNIDTFRQTITGQKRFFEQFRNVLWMKVVRMKWKTSIKWCFIGGNRHLIPQNRCRSVSWILPLTIRLTKIFVEVFVHCSDQHR